ncbi:hypothetical protein BGZ83_001330 [Gryganskiella cystojenkinii]|nr:hypothetical protein BGZ83_001330 [Gryganskiella cystojenkinii]
MAQFALWIWERQCITNKQWTTIMAAATAATAVAPTPVSLASTSSATASSSPLLTQKTPLPIRGLKTLGLWKLDRINPGMIHRVLKGFPDLEELVLRFEYGTDGYTSTRYSTATATTTTAGSVDTDSGSGDVSSTTSPLPGFLGLKRFTVWDAQIQTLFQMLPYLVDVDELTVRCNAFDFSDLEGRPIVEAFGQPGVRLRIKPFRKLEMTQRTQSEDDYGMSSNFMLTPQLRILLQQYECFARLETLILGIELARFVKACKMPGVVLIQGETETREPQGAELDGWDEQGRPVSGSYRRRIEYRYPSFFQTLRVLELVTPLVVKRYGRAEDQDRFWREYLPRMPNLKRLTIHDLWDLDQFPYQTRLCPRSPTILPVLTVSDHCGCVIHSDRSPKYRQISNGPGASFLADSPDSLYPSPVQELPVPSLRELTLHLYGPMRRAIATTWFSVMFDWVDDHFPDVQSLCLVGAGFREPVIQKARVAGLKRWPDMNLRFGS